MNKRFPRIATFVSVAGLSAILLAGCAAENPQTDATMPPASNATATPTQIASQNTTVGPASPSAAPATQEAVSPLAGVQETVGRYYAYAAAPSTISRVVELRKATIAGTIDGRMDTEEGLQRMYSIFGGGLDYYHITSSEDATKASADFLLNTSVVLKGEGKGTPGEFTFLAPADSITFTGADKAVVDLKKVRISMAGKDIGTVDRIQSKEYTRTTMDLTKTDNRWLIVPPELPVK